jgi:hypothetical protein
VQRYGPLLKTSRDLPNFVLDIKTPEGIVLAADYKYNALHELEGEVSALKLVDLEREGLGEYRSYLQRLGISYVGASNVNSTLSQFAPASASSYGDSVNHSTSHAGSGVADGSYYTSEVARSSSTSGGGGGRISLDEAQSILQRFASHFRNGNEMKAFFRQFDVSYDHTIDCREFKAALDRLNSSY